MTRKEVKMVSDEEVTSILDALKAPTATNVRNRGIFLPPLDTGLRAPELLTLPIPRAHLDEGYLLVLGKGKKEGPVKLGKTAAQAIRLYLTRDRPEPARPTIHEVFLTEGYRVRHGVKSTEDLADAERPIGEREEEEELLFAEPGWPLADKALNYLFVRLGRRSGVPRLHPHLLRHTYACRYLLAHRDPILRKAMLGLPQPAMTNPFVQAHEGIQLL